MFMPNPTGDLGHRDRIALGVLRVGNFVGAAARSDTRLMVACLEILRVSCSNELREAPLSPGEPRAFPRPHNSPLLLHFHTCATLFRVCIFRLGESPLVAMRTFPAFPPSDSIFAPCRSCLPFQPCRYILSVVSPIFGTPLVTETVK